MINYGAYGLKNLNIIWYNIKDGDEESFEILFKIMSRQLFSYALSLVNDKEVAEEIVHDSFINLWNKRKGIIIHQSVSSYLYKVVHNMSVNHLKRLKTERNQFETRISEDAWRVLTETYRCNSNLIEAIESEEVEKVINDAISDLPEQCRKIFLLSRYEMKQNIEISSELDISINTVRTQLFRALNKIKQKLSEKFPDIL